MITFQYLTLYGKDFRKTFSDVGNFIENQDGILYSEAYDLVESENTYIETDVNIEEWEKEQSEGNPEQSITPEIQ